MNPETHPHSQALSLRTITHLTMATEAYNNTTKDDIYNTKWGNIERLRGDRPTYYRWAMQIQSILMGAGVWKIVKGEEKLPISPPATEDKINQFHRRSQQASSLIFGSILTASQPTVREALDDPVRLWKL